MPVDAPFVKAAPAGSALYEGLVFNGLDLNNGPLGGAFSLEALDMTPPAKQPEWAKGADTDGQALVRPPLFANRTVKATLRVEQQVSMDAALTALGQLVDQIQEAEKNPGGTPLVWTPAAGSRTITFYALTGMVTGMPISVDQAPGWFVQRPTVTVEFTCKPFGYGAEVTGASASSGASPYVVNLEVAHVPGDVAAEARLVVTETQGLDQQFVEWGLEQRYYNPVNPMVQRASVMPLVSGTSQTRAGSVSATVIRTALAGAPGTVYVACDTDNLGHVGTYRVRARVYATATTVAIRLVWADGSNALHPNAWVSPVVGGGWVDVDLGLITITPAVAGPQRWVGYFQMMSSDPSGTDVVDLDFALFIPVAEGYGKARGLPTLPAIFASRTIEFRSDRTIRPDPSGIYGSPWSYRGARFLMPQAGSADRPSRIFVRACLGDVETAGYDSVPISAQVFYTPRYHVVPR